MGSGVGLVAEKEAEEEEFEAEKLAGAELEADGLSRRREGEPRGAWEAVRRCVRWAPFG